MTKYPPEHGLIQQYYCSETSPNNKQNYFHKRTTSQLFAEEFSDNWMPTIKEFSGSRLSEVQTQAIIELLLKGLEISSSRSCKRLKETIVFEKRNP